MDNHCHPSPFPSHFFSLHRSLHEKLKAMEEKLIKGGEVISKASKQEALLRKTEQELRERQIQEANLARELAEKEEANLQLEEHFSSLQEEVEVKTKKLKKLWNKYQAAVREAKVFDLSLNTDRFLNNVYVDWIRIYKKNSKRNAQTCWTPFASSRAPSS